MPERLEIEQIQNYLRASALANYQPVNLPPFTLFFHKTDSLKYFNYAIPDVPCGENLQEILAELRRVFQKHARTARFEFFEAFSPDLPASLRANGFVEEGRQWSMLCTPQTFEHAAHVPGLQIITLDKNATRQDAQDYLRVAREGFNPDEPLEITSEDIEKSMESFLRPTWHAFLGRIDGQAAGIGVYAEPIGGISEIAGIATRPAFRRRGIASQLTSHTLESAFNYGTQIACLTAEDERAGRVYERVGFRPFSIMLAYIDSAV